MSAQPTENRPAPGEEYNPGPATRPRQAATVILLRGGEQELELLLVKRNPAARFMGGVWVFPGGAVERAEGDDDGAHRAAAVRELREEAGIALPAATELVKFSRWITPDVVKTRFDTHFFLASLPAGQEPRVDGKSASTSAGSRRAAPSTRYAAEQIALVFPTIKHLEQLGAFATAAELLAYARGRTVEPVQPHIVLAGEVARVVLPGEPGY